MVVSKSKLGALVALGAVVLTVAVVLWLRTAPPPTDTKGADDTESRQAGLRDTPPPPREDLTDAERVRLAEIQQTLREARERISRIDRELVQARSAVVRTHPDARAALERRKAAQQRRAAAVAANADVVAARAKIAVLNEQRASVRGRFRALSIHDAEHGRPGPDGEPTPPVAGCAYCEKQDPADVHHEAISKALMDEDTKIHAEMKEAHAAHMAALKRVEADPVVTAALGEAKAADSDLQSIVQADNRVRELIRERDEWLEKRISLARDNAGILHARSAPGDEVSNRTEPR